MVSSRQPQPALLTRARSSCITRASEGRRVITLLPDFHLCILRATQIVETLPEYFARFPQPPRLATYISGPSATADIEMTRIKGVHGPRFLSVIIVRDEI